MPNVRNLLPHLACSPAIQDALSHSNLTCKLHAFDQGCCSGAPPCALCLQCLLAVEEFVTKDVHELPWPSQMDHVQRQEVSSLDS